MIITNIIINRNFESILQWVSNPRATGSTLKRKPPDRRRIVTTPENLEAAKASIEESTTRSTRKHTIALGISD